MARKLQDRLALASYKTQNGLDNLSFNLVEAHLDNSLKRKRPSSSIRTSSESSSSSSEPPYFSGALNLSSNTGPIFSDDFPITASARKSDRGLKYQSILTLPETNISSRKISRSQSMAPPMHGASRTSWKSVYDLPESSPGSRQHARFPVSHAANHSFASETTIPDSPPFGQDSDEEHSGDLNRPLRMSSSHFRSSPPCTPPPKHSRTSRSRKHNRAGEEGAELLLHLATSPSPANPGPKARMHAPSTPPSNFHALPSSMISTPGASGFMAGLSTPGQNFSWADFVNITPSPAQGAFGNRTPGLPKTPLAAKEARRRLNLDTLLPHGASPSAVSFRRTSNETGLGMELGGELVS